MQLNFRINLGLA